MTVSAASPEMFAFDDEVIVSGEDMKLSISLVRHPTGEATGDLYLSVNARWRDGKQFASYTPNYEYAGAYYQPGEIQVDDAGLLTAMHRQDAATGIDIRHGVTVQLPPEFIEPMRAAVQTVSQKLIDELAKNAGATSHAIATT